MPNNREVYDVYSQIKSSWKARRLNKKLVLE